MSPSETDAPRERLSAFVDNFANSVCSFGQTHREHYIGEFNCRFQVAAGQRGSAFLPSPRRHLERIFSLQFERTVNRDNTVSFQNLRLQIERVSWRGTLAVVR